MKAEIIAVGSEMLTPDHLDTNSLFITERLDAAGFELHLKSVVGDCGTDIAEVLQAGLRRSGLVILTGGLGPTEDDLTRKAVATVLGRPLRLDAEVLDNLRRKFASRGYPMPKINERQAEVIEGAELLENRVGTAPGMWIRTAGAAVVLLPGPPRELRPMFDSQVVPRLGTMGGGRRLERRSLHITGLTESEVDSRVAPIYKASEAVRVTILASPGHIALHLAQWTRDERPPAELEALAARIETELGDAVFSSSGKSLEEVIGAMLSQAGLTLAVAESCTAGLIGSRITRVPGSSAYFKGGVLCYSNDLKASLCRVPERILESFGAVSSEAAEALAAGVREISGAHIGLAVTGIAGPGGGTAEKPVGLVFVGLSDESRSRHARRIIPGDRNTMRERTAYFALSALRRFLMEKPMPGRI